MAKQPPRGAVARTTPPPAPCKRKCSNNNKPFKLNSNATTKRAVKVTAVIRTIRKKNWILRPKRRHPETIRIRRGVTAAIPTTRPTIHRRPRRPEQIRMSTKSRIPGAATRGAIPTKRSHPNQRAPLLPNNNNNEPDKMIPIRQGAVIREAIRGVTRTKRNKPLPKRRRLPRKLLRNKQNNNNNETIRTAVAVVAVAARIVAMVV
mmetsp:Transcript_21431/g.59439  ORF Transcript_21431/g.59439 Transcript_21431/m.59439 type:complete len:205 (-) Transcript_21431:416-1030(-)